MFLYVKIELSFLTFLQKTKYMAPLTREHEIIEIKFIERRFPIPEFLHMDPTYLSLPTFYGKKYAQL